MRLLERTVFVIAASLAIGSQASAEDPDPVCVYYEDFQEGPGGWNAVDLNQQDIYWNPDTYDDGGGEVGVMWCGMNNPSWIASPGYGNRSSPGEADSTWRRMRKRPAGSSADSLGRPG